MKKPVAAIGLKAKTGRAIAVALTGPPARPEFVLRDEILLADPGRPATGRPYHVVMDLPWPEAVVEVQPIIEAIGEIANGSLQALVANLRSLGFRVPAVVIVGPPDRALERIGNPHIRAHAAEGVLFRRVLEEAAAALRIRSASYREPADEMDLRASRIKATLARLGRTAGPPWRADEKSAASAAWLALEQPPSTG